MLSRSFLPVFAALLLLPSLTSLAVAQSAPAAAKVLKSATGSKKVAVAKRKSLAGKKGSRSLTAKKNDARPILTSYAATGIKNMQHAKKSRMSTAADTSKTAVRGFAQRASARYGAGTIVISNYTRRLFYIAGPGRVSSFPIATPRPSEIWTGTTRISDKKVDPDWYPTPDMREHDPELPEVVEGGTPQNPLGPRALYLGSSVYRIHGTNNPNSIGRPASGGCYRMHNKDIKALYNMVGVGTKVVVTNARSL